MISPTVDSVRELRLPSNPQAPAMARRAVREQLEGAPAVTLDAAVLLVSELVTNSVRHAGHGPDGTVVLRICRAGPAVRIEVRDWGRGFKFTPRITPLDRPGGWGLQLVDHLSHRWGVIEGSPTTVWFELE